MEITTLNQSYLAKGELNARLLGRGIAWFDTGTHQSLLQAANFVEAIEERQGMMIACLEEIGLVNGWIDKETIESRASQLGDGSYAKYVKQLVESR